MIDSTGKEWTEEEMADLYEKVTSHHERLEAAIAAGIREAESRDRARSLTDLERKAVSVLVGGVFSDSTVHEFDDDAAVWARYMAQVVSSQRLLMKVLAVMEMEVDLCSGSQIEDGPLGKAVDQVAEMLWPVYRLTSPIGVRV